MKRVLFILYLALHGAKVLAQEDPVVITEYGPIRGFYNTTVNNVKIKNFKGVQFAKQPVGNLRFMPLQAPDPWTEVYEAKKHGPVCLQIPGAVPKMAPTGYSEACTYTNIYTPENANENSNLPVFLYLHGSAYFIGSGDADIQGPENLVPHDIILVTVNYRLGPFGWLDLGIPEVPGNVGAKDVVFLLKWIQRNIRAFGGDPDNVTVGGHSVGGVITHHLTFSPMVDKSLVKRIISYSGNAFSTFLNTDPKRAKNLTKSFTTILGIESEDPYVILEELQSFDSEILQNATNQLFREEAYDFISFGSVIEKDYGNGNAFLTVDPQELGRTGCFLDVPQFIGFTREEGVYAAQAVLSYDLMDRYNQNNLKMLPEKILYSYMSESRKIEKFNLVMEKYFGDKTLGNDTLKYFLNFFTDVYFKYPGLKHAKFNTKYLKSETFLSEFQYVGNYNLNSRYVGNGLFIGAGHMDDVNYVFTAESQPAPIQPGTRDGIFSEKLTILWANYIKYGNPSPPHSLPKWPALKMGKMYYYQLNEVFETGVNPYQDLFEFYENLFDVKNIPF